jgi:nitric oxide reductase NorE protein
LRCGLKAVDAVGMTPAASDPRTPGAAPSLSRVPGVEGVWVFVGVDMMFFFVLFMSFMSGRAAAPALYEAARQTLDADFGGVNTLILLTSSWCFVLALEAARRDRAQEIARWLIASLICGFAFGVSKAFEYGAKFAGGITPASNEFYMYYFILTGLHLLHVLGGCAMLMIFARMARRGAFGPQRLAVLESGGIYWHMVDLLWILLFPLLYLMR